MVNVFIFLVLHRIKRNTNIYMQEKKMFILKEINDIESEKLGKEEDKKGQIYCSRI